MDDHKGLKIRQSVLAMRYPRGEGRLNVVYECDIWTLLVNFCCIRRYQCFYCAFYERCRLIKIHVERFSFSNYCKINFTLPNMVLNKSISLCYSQMKIQDQVQKVSQGTQNPDDATGIGWLLVARLALKSREMTLYISIIVVLCNSQRACSSLAAQHFQQKNYCASLVAATRPYVAN